VVGDLVLILNLDQFERKFGFLESLRDKAGEYYGVAFADIPVAGGDALLDACKSDLRMMSKLAAIHQNMTKYPKFAAALKIDKLVEFASTRPHIKINYQRDPTGKLEFIFDPADVKARWQILRLMADEYYLHSELTSMDWDVNSKAPS
jgi:hypothetical protein